MDYLLVFWLICALIAGAIYQGKGRPVAYGCLVGFFLGPLGILYAMARSTRHEVIEAKDLKAGKLKSCPYCGEAIRPEAIVCKHCGRDLPR